MMIAIRDHNKKDTPLDSKLTSEPTTTRCLIILCPTLKCNVENSNIELNLKNKMNFLWRLIYLPYTSLHVLIHLNGLRNKVSVQS